MLSVGGGGEVRIIYHKINNFFSHENGRSHQRQKVTSFKFLPDPTVLRSRRQRPPPLVITMRTPTQDNPFDSVSKQACKERLYSFFVSTARSEVGLGKLRVVQLFLKSAEFYGTRRFTCCRSLSWARSIQSTPSYLNLHKFQYGRIIYPYVFQAASLSSGLQLIHCERFSANLIFSANFFLPCVMIPSYFMKCTNRVTTQHAVSWLLYCTDVISCQDKLPYLMSQLENRRQSFTRIHFSQNLAFKMTFTFISTKYLTVSVQCWIYVPPASKFEKLNSTPPPPPPPPPACWLCRVSTQN